MTFNPLAAINVTEVSISLENKKSGVIDMGSQTLNFGPELIDKILQRGFTLNEITKTKLEEFKIKLTNLEKLTTKDFILSLGYKKYLSIDVNGAYGSLSYDLNEVIKDKYNYKKTYDLVINNGTGEHVFNQYSLFKNMHNFCSPGGIMLHILPFIDWINHGFYSFHPIVFGDIASSNNYKIKKMSFANRDGGELLINKEYYNNVYEQIKPRDNNSFFYKIIEHAKRHLGRNIIIVCALEKILESEFKIPLQGKYLSDVKVNKNFNSQYNFQALGSAKAKNQLADNLKRI